MDLADVVIIGGGPAGLNAALYAVRKELKTTLLAADIGGQMLLTNDIENYLGFPSISGFELSDKFEQHVRSYPVDFEMGSALSVAKEEDGTFSVTADDGKVYHGRACIVAAGRRSRKLDIPGEAEFAGRGVSYCATCDAPFYRKKTVAVVGGGDSAVQAAIELAQLCPEVYLIVRSRIRAQEILVQRMEEKENIKVFLGYVPETITGEKKVTALTVKKKESGEETVLAVDGVFVEAGGVPNNQYLPKEVKVNGQGEIVTDKEGRTSLPGLFAAGDVTDRQDKQVIIAAGEGAAAALAAYDYLLRTK